jgi:hypothetical protein
VRQIELLRFAIETLEGLGIPYAIVGSFASGAWGEPRMTRDIDIVVSLSPPQVTALCAAFPDDEFYVSQSSAAEAVRLHSQFNVIHPTSGNKIDFMIAGTGDWSAAQLARRKRVDFEPETHGYVAAPEDVILGKLIYYREGGSEKHLRDVAGILRTSGNIVDRDYVGNFAQQVGVGEIWLMVLKNADAD